LVARKGCVALVNQSHGKKKREEEDEGVEFDFVVAGV